MTPKAIVKTEKKDYVASLAETLKSASSAVLLDYTGLGVKLQEELKKRLRGSGGKMVVAKNTLIKLAGHQASLPTEFTSDELLTGQTALVVGTDDAVAPIQILGKFAKETESTSMKAGIVEGVFQSRDQLTKISTLPAKNELYAQVLGGVASPMYGLVGTLQGNLNKLVWILQAKVSSN